jgi:hypothetical protein
MNALTQGGKRAAMAALAGIMLLSAGCSTMGGGGAIPLSAAQEVPPNPSSATGHVKIRIGPDKSVNGGLTFTGMAATAAHIHEAPAGANGPVIIPLTKTSDTSFAVPPGASLTDAQYASYLAGNLYLNVHSAAYPGGEIRAQLKPE